MADVVADLHHVLRFHRTSTLDRAGPGLAGTDAGAAAEARRGIDEPWRPPSLRAFTGAPLALADVLALLPACYGVLSGRRNVASAGGLYELRAAVLGHGAAALFDPRGPMRAPLGPFPDVVDVVFHQLSGAFHLVVWLGAPERYVARYGPRGYRYMLLEAGMATQELVRVATGAGLSHCVVGGLDEDGLIDGLGLGLTGWLPLVACAVGQS